ncbi:MAG: hypothetical protein ACTHV1_08560 [Flaviflexus sp.]|uniref:hypothetical protein n=1 Tax=Flaviflexus sp. TaxID=1969482 RepID=UPI003F8FBD69
MSITGILLAGLLLVSGEEIRPVAIGDSYASGNGAGSYSDTLCMRSNDAASEVAAEFFGVDAINASCNGAWTHHLTEPRMISDMRRDISDPEGFGSAARIASLLAQCGVGMDGAQTDFTIEQTDSGFTALCSVTLDPQIQALGDATDVFVTIGGNDLGFVSVASACLIQEDEALCRTAVEDAEERLDGILESERVALVALKEINPDARVHLVPYPRLLEGDLTVGSYDVSGEIEDLQGRWETGLETMADDLNETHGGFYYVGAVTDVWDGHGLAGEEPWIHSDGNIAEILHPTVEGWTATGHAYLAHLGTSILNGHP